jgi:hypothetical protein
MDRHHTSRFAAAAGSNKAAAERYAAATGHSTTGAPASQLWGPHVHDSAATHAAQAAAATAAADADAAAAAAQQQQQ